MSADEIIFGEVKYREPVRARRPDRDPTWACIAYQVPQPGDLPIFLDRGPADAIERHALRDTSVELGGVLLGRECVDDQTGEPFVWVTESLEAKHYENTQASFTYTHDSWEEMTRARDRLHPDLDIVGWYHTHPDFGIFLSSHDLFIHQNFFAQPLQLAYVIDPIRQTRGFFRWRQQGLEQVGGYYLTGGRADRVVLARQVDDLESIASTEPPASGFSPRLEAELIAMLSRPHVSAGAPVSAGDRALLATVFGSLGLLLGGVVVAAGGWLANVAGQVRAQTAVLEGMQTKLDRADQVSQAAVASLLAQAGSTAEPKQFVADVTRTRNDLAAALVAVKNQEALAAAAATENRRLNADLDQVRKLEAEAREREQKYKAESEAERDAVRELTLDRDRLLDTDAGQASRRYTIAWYAAIGGWAVAGVIATAWGLYHWMSTLALTTPERPRPGDRPGSAAGGFS